MTTSNEATKPPEPSLFSDAVNLSRYYLSRNLGGRRGLIILAVTALVAGAWLNWGWLVAAGVAPILLAIAPCAIMCALGICASKKTGGKSCCSDDQGVKPTAPNPVPPPRDDARG